jgi:crotonobetainyl-CoA:carnitine CoA-transferase CaiB-like acyl-CoA transferase
VSAGCEPSLSIDLRAGGADDRSQLQEFAGHEAFGTIWRATNHRAAEAFQPRADFGVVQDFDKRLIASPIRLGATPVQYDPAPPKLGEHTESVLESMLKLDREDIARLRPTGAIG